MSVLVIIAEEATGSKVLLELVLFNDLATGLVL